jgi:Skp family chaperone for outer membrane proteins
MKSIAIIGALSLLSATPALAQPAAQPLGGPLVPGVCLLSQQAVVANAKVGVAAATRLKELAGQAQAEVGGERASIETDARALEGQRASLKPADFQQRQQALEVRVQALRQKAAQRDHELEATREKALGRIAVEAQSVIATAYKARDCGLLVDRGSVLGGNMTNDLTAAVVQGLDAKITTINFEREVLPPQAASAAPSQ